MKEWSSIEYDKTKTKVVTPTYHKGCRQFTESVETQSTYMKLNQIASGLALPHYTTGLKKIQVIFNWYSIRGKTKPNRDLLAHIFPHFALTTSTCMRLEF